jgi:ubiquinone/menaquinone biosynthesis C-methylase UbiE
MAFEADYYEEAVFWDGDILTDPGNMRRYGETAELVPVGTVSLLDVGCGNGAFGDVLRQRRPEIKVTGMDRSETALRHVKTEKLRGPANAIPVADCSYDCVTCLEMIEHLTCRDYPLVLGELCRVTRSTIIIGVPYRENLMVSMTQCPACHSQFHTELHMRSFDDESIRALLPSDKFRMTGTIFPGSKTRFRWIDPALSRLSRMRRKPPLFLSPICPVCGYSDGRGAERIKMWTDRSPSRRSLVRRIAASTFHATKGLLPKEVVPGYWIVALYERV